MDQCDRGGTWHPFIMFIFTVALCVKCEFFKSPLSTTKYINSTKNLQAFVTCWS